MAEETFTYVRSAPYTRAYLADDTWIATFTDDAYSVTIKGPERTLADTSGSGAPDVTHDIWVRTLETPFVASMSDAAKTTWLHLAREANCNSSQDIIALAYQYTEGAPNIWNSANDKRIAGDAKHKGPPDGCDFHDYVCDDWDPPDGILRPYNAGMCQSNGSCPVFGGVSQQGKIDCSGHVRLTFSYRNNFLAQSYYAKIPASVGRWPASGTPTHLPRISREIYNSGPGRITISYRTNGGNGVPNAAELAELSVGQVVFFDLGGDGTNGDYRDIDHMGIYVGIDDSGARRFISSRDSADGPTVTNASGDSVFHPTSSGTTFDEHFRAARRL